MTKKSLVRYEEMLRAIDACYKIDEVKSIRDKALAMELYLRQATDPEPERRACEIRLRAERKAGQLLAEMDRAQATDGRPNKASSGATLSSLGISRDQSARWQKLAGIPDEKFEAALAGKGRPSTTSILNSQKTPVEPMDEHSLWLWGRLRDCERNGLFSRKPQAVLSEMTEAMQADTQRLAPKLIKFLGGI